MPSSSPPSPPAPATSVAATPRRRRRRRLRPPNSTNSSTSSPFSFPPSPSPIHRFLASPLRASSVPFSWEHSPGIPKTPARTRSSKAGKPLPLPPSLLSRAANPYASSVVPAEYAAMPPPEHSGRQLGRVRVHRRSRPRPRVADALAEWLSGLSLYRSCKRAAACFASKLKSAAA